MQFFDRLLKRASTEKTEPKRHLHDNETEQKAKEFKVKIEQVKKIFTSRLEKYNSEFCQCAYPRFQQIIGIDCIKTSDSFKCFDTDLLIDLTENYFDIEKSDLTDECKNEKWICKKCGSTYEYGWSDFSIHVERQKLKLIELKAQIKGKPTIKPIPLYLGLVGHSYPLKLEMTSVSLAEFEDYLTEK